MSQVALVTGASEGIGHAIALRLLADGYRVALIARRTGSRANGITRLGKPEDVAELTSYLLSPRADLLQGAIVDLDGGMTKGM